MTDRPVADAAELLAAAGVASASTDAELLAAHVAGLSRGDLKRLLITGAFALTGDQRRAYDALVARRSHREPLQHLTGTAAFRGVELEVGPGVFVPRPETELLAGWIIAEAARFEAPVIVDWCTGSGAIAKAIAQEVPAAEVHAVELSEEAVAYATRNLAGTGVSLSVGDARTALEELVGAVDLIAVNPPYIPLDAWESVAREARDFDPPLALFSGEDGLVLIRELEPRAARLLRPGGAIAVEHADVQGESVPGLFSASGRWEDVRDHHDLAGRARFTTARLAR